MALLDTTQAMYGSVTSQYLIQTAGHPGYRGVANPYHYREYCADQYDLHCRAGFLVKEERGAAGPAGAFKPYSPVQAGSPGQENLPQPPSAHSQQGKVTITIIIRPHLVLSLELFVVPNSPM